MDGSDARQGRWWRSANDAGSFGRAVATAAITRDAAARIAQEAAESCFDAKPPKWDPY
jgi:hypothetical protein